MTIYGHHHLNVTSIDEQRRFFADTLRGSPLGGATGSGTVIRFPNALIFLRPQPPTGGTKGTTVNHIAFSVPDIRLMVDTVQTAGYPIVTRAEVPASLEVRNGLAYMADQETDVAFTMAPDQTKVEFIEVRSQAAPIALHHVHFAAPNVAEMKAWYVKTLDARPGKRGNFEAADLPGVNLTYSSAADGVVGTRGRSLDHIGFEVENLRALCRKLESMAVAVERRAASALITDPWGTDIELTEGLDEWVASS